MTKIRQTRPHQGTPDVASFAGGVGCPVELAAALTKVARRRGTLPPPLAGLRRWALDQARGGARVVDIAHWVGLSSGRISQLTAGGDPSGREHDHGDS